MQQKVTPKRPLSGQRTGKRRFCKKKSVAESFFFLIFFFLYLLGSFPPGPGWVGLPAPRDPRGHQLPLGGGGASATGLSARRAAAPPGEGGRAAPGLGKRCGRTLILGTARSLPRRLGLLRSAEFRLASP